MTKTPLARGGRRILGGRLEPAVLLGPGLIYLAVFMAVPVLLIFGYMFFRRGRFGGITYDFTLDNFARAFEPVFVAVYQSSLVTAGLATLLALLIGFPTAYAITKLPSRWRTVALVLVVVPFWTNFLIRTYAWIVLLNSQGIVNRALMWSGAVDEPVTLLYTRGAVVVGMVYAYLPLMILPIYAALEKLDTELLEAAANLGATRVRSFFTVTLPLTLPGVITGSILVFVPSLGNFVIPELLGGGKSVMIGNLVRDQFLKARDWPFGSVLAMFVVVALVVLFVLQSWVSRRVSGDGRRA